MLSLIRKYENNKGIYFQIGIAIALALILSAFEWKSYDDNNSWFEFAPDEIIPEEVIPITRQEMPPVRKTFPGYGNDLGKNGGKNSTIIEIVTTEVNDFDLNVNTNTSDSGSGSPFAFSDNYIEDNVIEDEVFTIVDEMPSFPGGEIERMKFLQKNIVYPKFARENGIQGTVYVCFIVEVDGRINNIRLLQGIGGGCEQEAIRVTREMPLWVPGIKNGKPIRVQVTMPLAFTLQS